VSRVYYLHDANGDRQVAESALPLQFGGEGQCDLVVPGIESGTVAGYIALADGHPYLQPAGDDVRLYHNHERVEGSRWLKSGDRVQVGESGMLLWQVRGDQVFVTAERFVPPSATPPGSTAGARSPQAELLTPAAASPPAAPRGRRHLVAGVLAALALVALFVLLAVPVTLVIEPAPEARDVDGLLPGMPLAGRLLLLPGDYRVTARREGYRDIDARVAVSRDGPRELRFALEELPGRLAVTLEPDVPYTLLVDGEAVAAGPDGLHAVQRGRHALRVESERYLPVEAEVDVVGLDEVQPLAFTLQPAWAELRLDSRPQGARVMLRDAFLGTTPLETELMQGTRTLLLELPGYKRVQLDLPVEAGKALVLEDIVLPPADGVLELDSTPPGATVTVDQVYRGTTPLRLELASGRPHRLRLALPGHRAVERDVELEAEQTTELRLKLSALLGTVFVSATPADAELWINGKQSGRATQRLRLATREHTLEFRRDGYATQRVKVTPNAAASQRVDVTLQTTAAAAEAATPATLSATGGIRLRLVRPGGPFRMGASRREAGRRANESARLVELTRPFYLGVTEVTNAQFRRFDGSHDSGRGEGAVLNADDQPVVRVDWDAAARFCNWMSRQEGLPEAYVQQGERMVAVTPLNTGYRLPTEAEWAYVARVHGRETPSRYPWDGGYPPVAVSGNYADVRIRDTLADTVPGYDDGYRGSAPIGSFAPWPEGFVDLGGNVAEWVHDHYAVYPGVPGQRVTDPVGPASGEHHVVRGASWRFGSITELRLSYRDYSRAARDDLGFRVARYAR
jgi:formylglycine-generating enzyme required for sulfatase activity